MLDQFLTHLQHTCGAQPTDRFLVAISGGVDSMVMGGLFHAAGLDFEVAHCNFGLRGEESEEDADFVQAQAEGWQVPFHSKRFDTAAFKQERGISTQMAARELRYNWFATLLADHQLDWVAVGSHQGDSTETMLINLLRGTGLRGLHGIAAQQGQVIRPLRYLSRAAIEAYAQQQAIAYRTDSSNASDDYLRNRIRHQVVPPLEAINPDLHASLDATAQRLKEAEEVYEFGLRLIRESAFTVEDDHVRISLKALNKVPAVPTVLYELLRPYGFEHGQHHQIQQALTGEPGKRFFSSTHCCTVDRNELWITPLTAALPPATITRNEQSITTPLAMTFEMISRKDFNLEHSTDIAQLDADRLSFPLTVRLWEPGDRFQPLGMNGSKKVSDFLIDAKVPLPLKEKTHVLVANNQIVWLIGHRIDDRFKVAETTENIYIARLTKR